VSGPIGRGESSARVFGHTASRYWLTIFPCVRHEIRRWRRRALEIPDPDLRRLALTTQRVEQGNLEGAAAFAVLVPPPHRSTVVRALVAFQVIYDYVDALAEEPNANPTSNGRQLHQALLDSLDLQARQRDYYAHYRSTDDRGYLSDLIDACRSAFGALPSHATVTEPALRSVDRMIAYQILNHEHTGDGSYHALAQWASTQTPPSTGLRWWETSAGAASSLVVFALIAAAAQPRVDPCDAIALEAAYFPWIGALHVLLDSLIDRSEDARIGQHSLVDHYASPHEVAARLQAITARALCSTASLPMSAQHSLILAAMTSFYLSAPQASSAYARLAKEEILATMGSLAKPTMRVLNTRRAIGQLARRAPQPFGHRGDSAAADAQDGHRILESAQS
jgi:tetraprenyl-beta-curcumene synthase